MDQQEALALYARLAAEERESWLYQSALKKARSITRGIYQRPAKGDDGNYPFEVGIATIPQADASNRKVISQGPSVCIFKKANVQEEYASWLFVKYLTTSVDFQAEFSMASGCIRRSFEPVCRQVPGYAAHQCFRRRNKGRKAVSER